MPGLFWDIQFKIGKRMGQGLGAKGRRTCGHQMATHSMRFQLHSIWKSNGILLKMKHQVLLLRVLHSQQTHRLWQRLLAHEPSFAYQSSTEQGKISLSLMYHESKKMARGRPLEPEQSHRHAQWHCRNSTFPPPPPRPGNQRSLPLTQRKPTSLLEAQSTRC